MQNRLILVFGIIGIIAMISIGVIASQGFMQQPTSPVQTEQTATLTNAEDGIPSSSIQTEEDELAPWEQAGLTQDPNEGETEEIARADIERDEKEAAFYDAEFAELEAREGMIYDLVIADERVKRYLEDAYSFRSDFTPAEKRQSDADQMIITIVGRQSIEGDWQTSYVKTYSGMLDLKILVKDGAIMSVEEIPKENDTKEIVFTEEDKVAISVALADSAVKAAMEGKENTYIRSVYHQVYFEEWSGYDCPPGHCASIVISKENTKAGLHVVVNTLDDKVVRVDKAAGW